MLLLAVLVVGPEECEDVASEPPIGRLDARHRIRPGARGDRDRPRHDVDPLPIALPLSVGPRDVEKLFGVGPRALPELTRQAGKATLVLHVMQQLGRPVGVGGHDDLLGGVGVVVEVPCALRPAGVTRVHLEPATVEREEVVHLMHVVNLCAELLGEVEVVRRQLVLGVLAVIAGMLLRSRQPNVPAVQQSVKTAVSSTATRHVDDEFSKDVAAAPANDNYSEFTPASALPAAPKLPVAASAFIPRADISSVPITTTPSTTPPSAGVPPKPSPVPKRPATVVAAIKTGSLAVSSPTATDIYSGDKYLGSTPITLELSAGTHMLEYRHLDQRKSVTHVVKASEATTTMVTSPSGGSMIS